MNSSITVGSMTNSALLFAQAAQVRKSCFVPNAADLAGTGQGVESYHPTTHHSCTVHAGTIVQQASDPLAYVLASYALQAF